MPHCPVCETPAIPVTDPILREETPVLRCGCFGLGDVLAAGVTPPRELLPPCPSCGAVEIRTWLPILRRWNYHRACAPECSCEECEKRRHREADAQRHAEAERQSREHLQQVAEHDARLAAARIPARFGACTIEGFERSALNEPAVEAVAAYVADLGDHLSAGRGLWLVGPVGVGKTHLAVAVLRCALGAGFAGLYLPAREYMRQLRHSYGDEAPDPLPEAGGVQLLVFDDLGSVRLDRNPEHVREALLDLLDRRYLDMRPTIITSNRTAKELREEIDERIVSRLSETCARIVLPGEDYRLRARG